MHDFQNLMEPDYAQIFEMDLNAELINDAVCEGSNNIRKEFLRTIYFFFLIEILVVMLLGLIPAYLFQKDASYSLFAICLTCLFLNQLIQFYFQYHGKIFLGKYRKLFHYTLGSLSIFFHSFSYYSILICINFSQSSYGYFLYLLTPIQLFVTVFVLTLIGNFTQASIRTSLAFWLVPLIIPQFICLIYTFILPYVYVEIMSTQIVSWLGIIILMMTQEMKTKQENYEAMFINSCRLLGAPFQILVYVYQFMSQSRRDDTLIYKATQTQKLQYLRKIATTLSIITLILVLVQISQMYQIGDLSQLIIQQCTLISALLVSYQDFFFKPLFFVSVSLSIILYILIFVIKDYHWIIVWTLFILQITFYQLSLLGLSWYLALHFNYFDDQNKEYQNYQQEFRLQMIGPSFSIFNSAFLGFMAYTFLEQKQFKFWNAFCSMQVSPFIIIFNGLIIGEAFNSFMVILAIFEIYALLILVQFKLNLNLEFLKLQDYSIESMMAFEPIFGYLTIAFQKFKNRNKE